MTVPFVEYVWFPLTTVSFVPGITPVLLLPGLPVRGAGGFGDGRWLGRADLAGVLGATEAAPALGAVLTESGGALPPPGVAVLCVPEEHPAAIARTVPAMVASRAMVCASPRG